MNQSGSIKMMDRIKYYAFLTLMLGCMFAAPIAAADALDDGRRAYREKDYAVALKLLEPLAQEGNAGAQATIGEMYSTGSGVVKNTQEAIKWYLLAAKQSNLSAQSSLSAIYLLDSPEKDLVKSYMWAIILTEDAEAVKEKNMVALGNLVKLTLEPKMTPAQKEQAVKLASERQSAKKDGK